MSAGARSVHQINVERMPDGGKRAFVAALSMITLALLLRSCPVMIRRIGEFCGNDIWHLLQWI
jgi:hypothetical protein